MENNEQTDFHIVQLLCSRLCHDLAGPAGAIHNGMEILEESPEDQEDALGLVAMSVKQLNVRLAFFRLAFGMGGLSGRKPPFSEAHDLATAYLSGGRSSLDWQDSPATTADAQPDQKKSAEVAKLVLNMILFAAESLPRGGVLEVRFASTLEDPAARGLMVRGVGQGASVKNDRMAALSHPVGSGGEGLTAHNVHGYFVQRMTKNLGGQLEVTAGTDEVKIAAVFKDSPRNTVI